MNLSKTIIYLVVPLTISIVTFIFILTNILKTIVEQVKDKYYIKDKMFAITHEAEILKKLLSLNSFIWMIMILSIIYLEPNVFVNPVINLSVISVTSQKSYQSLITAMTIISFASFAYLPVIPLEFLEYLFNKITKNNMKIPRIMIVRTKSFLIYKSVVVILCYIYSTRFLIIGISLMNSLAI